MTEWNLNVFDSRDRKQLNPLLCLRDHKKRKAWTGEFYDQSYQRRPTDQEVPTTKAETFGLLIARRRSFWIRRRAVSVE